MDMVLPDLTQLLTTAVGFLLFVWVLAKYAWGPILNLLDQRRDKIESDFASAEMNLAASEDLKGEFELKLADIKVIEREKIQEAVHKGEELSDSIVSKARNQAEETKHKAVQDLDLEVHKAQLELRDSVADMAIGAAEKVIGVRLDDDLHRKLILDYINQLGELPNA